MEKKKKHKEIFPGYQEMSNEAVQTVRTAEWTWPEWLLGVWCRSRWPRNKTPEGRFSAAAAPETAARPEHMRSLGTLLKRWSALRAASPTNRVKRLKYPAVRESHKNTSRSHFYGITFSSQNNWLIVPHNSKFNCHNSQLRFFSSEV